MTITDHHDGYGLSMTDDKGAEPEKAMAPRLIELDAKMMREAADEIDHLHDQVRRLSELNERTERLLALGERGVSQGGYGEAGTNHARKLRQMADDLAPAAPVLMPDGMGKSSREEYLPPMGKSLGLDASER